MRLMPRDHHLLGAVGIARYLSTEQLLALFFEGRTQRAGRRRLQELAAGGGDAGRAGGAGGYIRSAEGVAFDGKRIQLWSLTARGVSAVQASLGLEVRVVERALSAQFLAHQAGLSDVFVALVARAASRGAVAPAPRRHGAPATDFPRVAKLPFRWSPSDAARLPWREFDGAIGAARDRYIAPDATFEMADRRVFVEFETGSHPLVSTDSRRRGATAQKLAAYDSFVSGFAGVDRKQTHYAAHFGDALRPEVLFVVGSEERAVHVRQLVSEYRAQGAKGPPVRAFSVSEAVEFLLPSAASQAAGAPSASKVVTGDGPQAAMLALSSDEVRAFQNLYTAYVSWRAEAQKAGMPRPEKPADLQHAYLALRRLRNVAR